MSINQFNLKDKESFIIKNPSGFKRLEEEKTEINLDFQIENCVKIVMINGKLNTHYFLLPDEGEKKKTDD